MVSVIPSRLVGLACLITLALPGCGLVLDVDPPDQPPSGIDAATPDAGATDAGPRPCEADSTCDDGDACNGAESCAGGSCAAGAPLACDDDGDACNGVETCDPTIGCTAVDALDCHDDVECTRDACEDGGCSSTPDDTLCTRAAGGLCDVELGCQYPTCDATTCTSDGCASAHCEGNTCVRSSLCADTGAICCGGLCVAGCDDGNDCTDDTCGTDGCVHAPVDGRPCAGDACAIAARCAEGRCVATTDRTCGDGNPCTLDTCDPVAGCAHSPVDGVSCSDGDACTAGDLCVAGTCVAGTLGIACEIAPGSCATARCDPALGCVAEPVPAGTACSTSCTETSGCAAGQECCVRATGAAGFCVDARCDACCRIGITP